jgi:hypothetical protein
VCVTVHTLGTSDDLHSGWPSFYEPSRVLRCADWNPPTVCNLRGTGFFLRMFSPSPSPLGVVIHIWDHLTQCGPTRGPRTYLLWPANHTSLLILSNFSVKSVTFCFYHCHYFCTLLAARHACCIVHIGPHESQKVGPHWLNSCGFLKWLKAYFSHTFLSVCNFLQIRFISVVSVFASLCYAENVFQFHTAVVCKRLWWRTSIWVKIIITHA